MLEEVVIFQDEMLHWLVEVLQVLAGSEFPCSEYWYPVSCITVYCQRL